MDIAFQDATTDIICAYDLNHRRLISGPVFLLRLSEYSKIAPDE